MKYPRSYQNFLASVALLSVTACGSASNQPVATPPDAQFPQNQNTSGFNSAQSTVLNAILGRYSGTVFRFKGKPEQQSQAYTFQMSQSTTAQETGALEFDTSGPVGNAHSVSGLRLGMNGSLAGVDTDGVPIYMYSFISSKIAADGLMENPYSFEIGIAMKNGRTFVPSRSYIKIWECVLGASLTCTQTPLEVKFGSDLSKQ